MYLLILSVLFSVVKAENNTKTTESEELMLLQGEKLAKSMVPMLLTGAGVGVGTIVLSSMAGNYQNIIIAAGGGMATLGIVTVGSTLGAIGNYKMINDLESQGIYVDKTFQKYAKRTAYVASAGFAGGIILMNSGGVDELLWTSPLLIIPIFIFLEKQKRVSLSAYEKHKRLSYSSEVSNFQVMLVPSPQGLLLHGTF